MSVFVVRAPARIACCLLDMNGELGRIDGTLGFALQDVGIEVAAESWNELIWDSRTPVASAIASGIELAERMSGVRPQVKLEVRQWIHPHVGLGHKTQTVLAVALACLRASSWSGSADELVMASGRGGTSGAGVHSFLGGGVVIDAGHRFGPNGKASFVPSSAAAGAKPPALVTRIGADESLRVVLGITPAQQGLFGDAEVSFFRNNFPLRRSEANEMIANVFMRLAPALLEGDLDQINKGIRAIQQSHFKQLIWSQQARPIREVGERLAARLPNVGLSSMGSTMYTITDVAGASFCADAYKEEFSAAGLETVILISRICAQGATVATDTHSRPRDNDASVAAEVE